MKKIKIQAPGWLAVKHIYSTNYNLRPENIDISLIVIHNISLPPEEFENQKFGYINQLFTNCLNKNKHDYFKTIYDNKVSSHFLIQRNGVIIQYVSTYLRAWHAGISEFKDIKNCNDYSIGIELEGSDFCGFEDEQYSSLIQLIYSLKNYHTTLNYITSHSHIASNRKTDPGKFFNWKYLQEEIKDFWDINNIIV